MKPAQNKEAPQSVEIVNDENYPGRHFVISIFIDF